MFGKLKKRVKYEYPSIILMGNRQGPLGWLQALVRISVLRLRYGRRFSILKKHLGFGPLFGKLEFLTWQKYVPVLLHLPDIFHVQWAKSADDWIFLKRLFGVKLVLSLRGTHINYSPLVDTNLAEMYRKVFPEYNCYHGVSNSIINEAMSYGVTREKSNTIYSGVKIGETVVPLRRERGEIRILAVGRFHWIKGYHYLLHALALLQSYKVNAKLTLITQGEMPEEFLYQLHDLGLTDAINWIPGMPHDSVLEQMEQHDLLILPSVEEGIANVVLEAMSVGLPVVSTDCGGIKEVIVSGRNGFLVPLRNPEALAKAIVEVQQLSVEEIKNIQRNAFASIDQKFNLSKNIKEFVSMYKEVLSCV